MRPSRVDVRLNTPNSGLSSAEAAARLLAEGPNELPHQKVRGWLTIALSTLRQPIFALLLGSGAVYLLLGDTKEAVLLTAMALGTIAISVGQEARSEKVLGALRDLTSPRALVIRDGAPHRIPSRELVRGDLVSLVEGDRVPADATLRTADNLLIDESLLTGEAVPVRKRPERNAEPPADPGGDDTPFVYSSTLAVRGNGLALVTATGEESRVGRIGRALADIEMSTPRLVRETAHFVRIFGLFGLFSCLLATVLFGFLRGSWLNALLVGIALGMSMVPEEFALVLTVFTAMGARRLSRAGVLTRRAAAIETLGAATVLCTDKTGTLTENRMTLVEVHSGGAAFRYDPAQGPWPAAAARVIAAGRLASAADPFDPMEKAFFAPGLENAPDAPMQPVRTYPLTPARLAVIQAWSTGPQDRIAAKGAPETISQLCRLSPEQAQAIRAQTDAMAEAGLRVLGVAEVRRPPAALPDDPAELPFTFLGLVGLADPLRAGASQAMRECAGAGVRVIMITGDYPLTALAIGRQAGLAATGVATGPELAAMDEARFAAAVARSDIFARITPDQKLRLIRALQATGAVVAMTGDGVNDAPALRAADIGVAMGGRGTDVAREAADIVLLDDDFASIVRTIRLGRRIYDNLRKAMGYIIAVHIPIAGISLLPLLTGLPIMFGPIHIAFLEMIIDPMCSFVFEAEPEEPNVMRRKPRPPQARLLSPALIRWSLLQGLLAFLAVAAVYLAGVRLGMAAGDLRALTFIVVVTGNLGLVLVNRGFTGGLKPLLGGKLFWLMTAGVIAILVLAVQWRPAGELLGFGAFHRHDLVAAVAAWLALVGTLEGIKMIWPDRFKALFIR